MINKFFYLLLIIIIILICYFIYKEIKKLNKIEKFKDYKCSTNEINELCDKKYIYIKGLKGDKGKLGITQSIGPGYRVLSKVKWLFGKFAIIKSQNFKHAVSSKINMQKARKIAFAPHINIGVFSLEKKI